MRSLHTRPSPRHRVPILRWDPLLLGTIGGLLSAVGYTAANIFLRALIDCDPVWVSCVKSSPTVALFAPFLAWQMWRKKFVYPGHRALTVLIVGALFGNLGGNVGFQWALGVIGISLAVPLTLGGIIVAGAIMGRLFLGEPVTRRVCLSVLLLTVAIAVLSMGASDAHQVVSSEAVTQDSAETPWWLISAGVVVACGAGLSYAVLGVAMRSGLSGEMSPGTAMVTVCGTGVITLGALSIYRHGPEVLFSASSADFGTMLAAGVCNCIAFLALTIALKLTSLVYVNALSAAQAALAALAGVMIYREPLSAVLCVGVLLTALGIVLMKRDALVQQDS